MSSNYYRPVSMEEISAERGLAAALTKKLSICYTKIGWIAKTGVNAEQNYKFASAEAIYCQVRAAMAEVGLALVPVGILNLQRERLTYVDNGTEKPTKGYRYMAEVPFRLVDTDTGYYSELKWMGECIEYQDKGIPKLITTATKYLIRCLFLIPTGEDPDESSPSPEDEARPAARPQQQAKDAKPRAPGTAGAAPVPPAVLTLPEYEEYRATCASKGLDPVEIQKLAVADGVKSKTELLLYVHGFQAKGVKAMQGGREVVIPGTEPAAVEPAESDGKTSAEPEGADSGAEAVAPAPEKATGTAPPSTKRKK